MLTIEKLTPIEPHMPFSTSGPEAGRYSWRPQAEFNRHQPQAGFQRGQPQAGGYRPRPQAGAYKPRPQASSRRFVRLVTAQPECALKHW